MLIMLHIDLVMCTVMCDLNNFLTTRKMRDSTFLLTIDFKRKINQLLRQALYFPENIF